MTTKSTIERSFKIHPLRGARPSAPRRPARIVRWRTVLLLGSLLLGAIAGAAGADDGAAPATRSEDPGALARLDVREPLRTDEEMARWVREVVGSDPARRPDEIWSALERSGGFAETVFPIPTPTAIETFHRRSTNCVGFALMFVALAREADVPAFFLLVPETRGRSRRNDLDVVEYHLAAAVRRGDRLLLWDLDGPSRRPPRSARPVSDLTALAVVHSNRGAEALAAGEIPAAIGLLEIAVALDPRLAPAWVNLGVARRRSGDLGGAIESYRRGLRADPANPAARKNLGALLSLLGPDPGSGSDGLVPSLDPLRSLDLAGRSLDLGDLERARDLYGRALTASTAVWPRP